MLWLLQIAAETICYFGWTISASCGRAAALCFAFADCELRVPAFDRERNPGQTGRSRIGKMSENSPRLVVKNAAPDQAFVLSPAP